MNKKLVDQAQFIGGFLDGRLIPASATFHEVSAAVDTDRPGQWARNYRRIERASEDRTKPQAFYIDKSIEAINIDAEIERCRTQHAAVHG